MYSILAVIYGYPLTGEIVEAFEAEDDEAENYFETYYSGMGNDTPGYLGFELETVSPSDSFDFRELNSTCEAAIKEYMHQQLAKKVSELPEGVQALLKPVGIYGIWYTS